MTFSSFEHHLTLGNLRDKRPGTELLSSPLSSLLRLLNVSVTAGTQLYFYTSVLVIAAARGVRFSFARPSHYCGRHISETPWGTFFKFGRQRWWKVNVSVSSDPFITFLWTLGHNLSIHLLTSFTQTFNMIINWNSNILYKKCEQVSL